MKNEINDIKKDLNELLRQRKILDQKIHNTRCAIWGREHYTHVKNNNTDAFSMFGKHYKDLSPQEKRQYNAQKQRERRARNK